MRENIIGTRAVEIFPEGRSDFMLITARLRYGNGKEWGSRGYMEMSRLNCPVLFELLAW